MRAVRVILNGTALALAVLACARMVRYVRSAWAADDRILPAPGTVATLLVAFEPKDCTSYARFITDWRRVEADSIGVIGVPINVKDEKGMQALMRSFKVTFPVRTNLASAVLKLVDYGGAAKTPVALLLDERGNLRLLIEGGRASIRQIEVEAVVMNYRHVALVH